MKRILLSFCLAASTLFAAAKDYTDMLSVTISGIQATPTETTINVEETTEGQINIVLRNFILEVPGADPIYVGHIYVDNVELTQGANYDSFSLVNRQVRATAGDKEGVHELQWIGQKLSDQGLFIDMDAKISDTKFYCTLGLEFSDFDIDVVFGTDDFPSSVLSSAKTDDPDKLVNVYTILGTLAKSNVRKADALDGLQRGIYIVDGKKVIKQ